MRVVFLGKYPVGKADVLCELNAAGISTVEVQDTSGPYLELLHQPTDAVIIDLDIGEDEASAILRHLRTYGSTQDLGIIVLGDLSEAKHRVHALSNGADVCLARPIDSQELLAYLKNIERRRRPAETKPDSVCWRFLQSEWRLIAPSGAQIDLSHLESSFVQIVTKNAGKPVKRRDIIVSAFGKDPLSYDSRRLEAVVSRLRRKVHRVYPLSQPIKVVHSIGYVFTDVVVCC